MIKHAGRHLHVETRSSASRPAPGPSGLWMSVGRLNGNEVQMLACPNGSMCHHVKNANRRQIGDEPSKDRPLSNKGRRARMWEVRAYV
jgi:hypothetical protein